jgi:hypothetical protein
MHNYENQILIQVSNLIFTISEEILHENIVIVAIHNQTKNVWVSKFTQKWYEDATKLEFFKNVKK